MTGDVGACRSCRAMMRWARTTSARIPLDLNPSEEGNVLVEGGRAFSFKDHGAAVAYAEAHDMDTTTYMPHHATCPARARHSGPTVPADVAPPLF